VEVVRTLSQKYAAAIFNVEKYPEDGDSISLRKIITYPITFWLRLIEVKTVEQEISSYTCLVKGKICYFT
jgi:hypothetical protein